MAVQTDAEDELYRRIFSYHIVKDGDGVRISSSAFTNRSGLPDPHCSVYLARLTSAAAVLAAGLPNLHLAGLLARTPLTMGLSVEHDNVPGDHVHCVIVGLTTKQECAELASAAYPVVVSE